MKKDFTNNDNSGSSSIFKARLKEQDLASQEKLQEIQGAADELARQAIIDKLRQAEVEHEKLKLKLEQEASDGVNNLLSHVELNAAENEDNFTSGIDGLLAKLFKFFNFMDSELGVETDPQVYRMIKKREEQEKEAWVATVIKFLRDKFNKLVKAIFSRDLSFQQKIDKEIKELYERLFGGSLSPEEEAAILERLEALRDLKLKLQIFVVGSVIAMFAELFSVELTASVETTKEEGKEKASAKEATKEVRDEIIEIKVDPKEKPTIPVSLFDFSSGVARPITLTKPELDLLPKPLKDILPPAPKDDMNKGNSGGLKPEVKERQENENKKPTQPLQEPKKATPPLAPKQGPAASTTGMEPDGHSYRYGSSWGRKKNSGYKRTLNQLTQDSIPNGKASEQSVKSSVADYEYDFTSMGTWDGAEHESPTSEFNNVKITRGRSADKTLQ